MEYTTKQCNQQAFLSSKQSQDYLGCVANAGLFYLIVNLAHPLGEVLLRLHPWWIDTHLLLCSVRTIATGVHTGEGKHE